MEMDITNFLMKWMGRIICIKNYINMIFVQKIIHLLENDVGPENFDLIWFDDIISSTYIMYMVSAGVF